MLRVSLTFNGDFYRILLRNKDHRSKEHRSTVVAESRTKKDLFPLFKSIRRNWYKKHKTIYI